MSASTAFEGTVSVEIREDGTVTPVTTDFVTGGGNGEMGPFSKAINFGKPTASGGAIILKTFGTENNILWEASVVRVHFSGRRRRTNVRLGAPRVCPLAALSRRLDATAPSED